MCLVKLTKGKAKGAGNKGLWLFANTYKRKLLQIQTFDKLTVAKIEFVKLLLYFF
jgi:hypothetical protein